MIHIFSPPAANKVTGGFLFNEMIARALPSEICHVHVPPARLHRRLERVVSAGGFVCLDSLYLRSPVLPAEIGGRCAMMVHLLPSLLPAVAGESPSNGTSPADGTGSKLEQAEAAWAAILGGFLVPSNYLARTVAARGIPPERIRVCEPGVDGRFAAAGSARAHRKRSPCPGLLTVANILPSKGYMELLEVLETMAEFPWVWHIAGGRRDDPAYSRAFFERVRAGRLRARIRYHGKTSVAATAALMRDADLFVLATRFETYGLALAEARAAGLPVVTNLVGGTSEALHGAGLFCAPDDRSGWRAALEPLLREPERIVSIGVGTQARGDGKGHDSTDQYRSRHDAALDFVAAVASLFPGVRRAD